MYNVEAKRFQKGEDGEAYDDGTMTGGQHDSGLVVQGVVSDDNSVFSTFTHNRPYTEVISGSQGSFNFLQESQLDLDCKCYDQF